MTNLIHRTRRNGTTALDRAWAPLAGSLLDWQPQLERLTDFWSQAMGGDGAPLMDVRETDEQIIVRAEIPGIDPSAIDVNLTGNVLMLSGEKVDEDESTSGNHYYSERRFGSFQRSVKLPCPVDVDTVRAEHKHGVVTVTLHKAEAVRPRRIQIEAAS